MTALPVWPKASPWLRFEVLLQTYRGPVSLCIGFVFDRRWSYRFLGEQVAGAAAIALTGLPWQPPPAGVPGLADGGGEAGARLLLGARQEPAGQRPVLLDPALCEGVEILYLQDWPGLGRRLVRAHVPDPAFGAARLILPAAGPATRVVGYARDRGLFPVAPALHPE